MAIDLADVIERLGRPRVLVLGDVMLDRYTLGTVERISPEAPVPVMRIQEQRQQLGGAGSVAAMLRSFEAAVVLVGVTGDDEDGGTVNKLVQRLDSDACCILADPARPTTVKHRFIGRSRDRHSHQMLRADLESCQSLSSALESRLLAFIDSQLPHADILLVSDYGKGVCTPALVRGCVERARVAGKQVLVDPPLGKDYERFARSSCLTPNRVEVAMATGLAVDTPEQALLAGAELRARLAAEAVVVTLDRDGMALVHQDGRRTVFPTDPRQVYDVTGAGDMVLSVLGLCLAVGIGYEEAIVLANLAAGLEVERLGVATLSRAELLAEIRRRKYTGPADKFRLLPSLLVELKDRRSRGERIVFTNGCFDIVHAGHIHCLTRARSEGEFLIVGLNSDASVRRLKGEGRPLHGAMERVAVLTALECVDAVVIFEEDTPQALVEALRPHVLVKGGDYRVEEIAGHDVVQAAGGRVVLVPLLQGHSSSRLRRHMA